MNGRGWLMKIFWLGRGLWGELFLFCSFGQGRFMRTPFLLLGSLEAPRKFLERGILVN